MEISVKKDSHGFIAEVKGNDYLYAHGETKELAKKELLGVIEMMMDYHLELLEKERKLKNRLLIDTKDLDYAL